MSTHASLFHNFHIFRDCTKCDDTMIAVCCLTHSDVIGLLCHYLFVPFCGGTGYFMSPAMFLDSPSLWVQTISKYRCTFGIVPNHALNLATADDMAECVDLSSLIFLANASESVSVDSMKKFHERFSPYGLRQYALRALYGLSEHTVHLSASREEDLLVERGQVSNGRPHNSVTVKVVDPDTRIEVVEGEEGEIWVHSESKALGYWRKEELSKKTFHAELVGDKDKTYLRTGDMGFVSDGCVFIMGHRENLITVSGRNIHLNDIENRLELELSELRSGRTVAVEWDSTIALVHSPSNSDSPIHTRAPRKGVAFFAELRNEDHFQSADCHRLAERIAARIGLDFHVETLLVSLLPLNTMPHSGSGGKRQRSTCKTNLLNGTLQVIHQWTPSTMGNTLVKPESIPLPPTPIPSKPNATRPLNQPSPNQHPSSSTTRVPDLNLETSPTSEEIAAVPRKESRFCLEDAPLTSQERSIPPEVVITTGVTKTPCTTHHLDAPDADRKEKSKRLVGQEKPVMDIISRTLEAPIEMDTNIWEHGCDSIRAIEISECLEQQLGFSVEAHLLYAYQTPRALLEKLKRTLLQLCSPVSVDPTATGQHTTDTSPPPPLPRELTGGRSLLLPSRDDEAVIVSMACRFPGCDSPEQLWQLLTEKAVTISHFKDLKTGKSIHGGFTKRMANFDHKWFGVSKIEASKMDPQQSMLLHTAWECLQRSGYHSLDEVKGSKIGVFIGFWGSDARSLGLVSGTNPPCTSYIGSLTANRISYVFDLKGPSMAIDTACAASLTALEVAVSYIHQGKCSQALVGGVNALLDPRLFEIASSMGVLSPKGESRVFDVEASGYVRGEGCGVVLLKRVGDALKHGNRLLAVVKSVESLHNGNSATLTAPSKHMQCHLLHTSLGNAMLGPSDVSYIEAHGTGTPLGDPLEINAIQEVFGQPDAEKIPRVGPLIIGSIKANIGHLEAGAGIAGLIKTILVLEHAKAPGNPGLKTINPALNVNPDKCLLLQEETVSLDKYYMYRPNMPNLLTAGVNSFGIGGSITNAILQQYSQLPHLGQVQCSLILCGEYGDTTTDQIMGAIQLLRARLQSFNSAYLSCVEAFQRAVKPVKVLTSETYYHHPAYLMFCLLYSTVRTLQAHDIELSFLMGTNLCAEVVVLAIAEVLILSDAMRLLLAGMAPQVFNIKFIIEEEMQPTTSFLSPTLNQLSLPGRFPPASLNQLIYDLQRTHLMQSTCSDPTQATNLVNMAKGGYGPLLSITLDPNSTIMKAVTRNCKTYTLLQLHNPSLINHLRDTCLTLRQTSDEMALKDCDNPSDEVVMPTFYDRYPMRSIQRGYTTNSRREEEEIRSYGTGHNTSGSDHREVKPKQRLSCADESGYITRATSAESIKSSTPAISPIKSQDPSPTSSGLPRLTKSSPSQQPEQTIIDDILNYISNELIVDLVQTDKEADRGLFELGLDSVSLIELQDHLLQSFKIDIPLVRITELRTIRAIATEIAKKTKLPVATLPSKGTKEQQQDEKTVADRGRYYTLPSIETLSHFTKNQLKMVSNFTVGRADYGKVEFLGNIDISQLDLHRPLVEITHCSIKLCESSKPYLNRPALLFYEKTSSSSPLPSQDGSDIIRNTMVDPVKQLLKSLSGSSARLLHSDSTDGQLVIKVERFY